jgi:lipopolysaccharide transport system permease protein
LANSLRHYLDVVVVLAQKDFKVRYRNSFLGFFWSLLNPLAYMVILTVVFSLLLRVNVPNFAAWVLIGLLVWRFFSLGTNQGLFSIVNNPSLVSKVYLPRYLIVLSNNVANLVGAALEFTVLLPLLFYLGVTPSFQILFLPLILLFEFVIIFGLSLSLSALNVTYRDFYQIWDIALQLGFFLSPIVYDTSFVPARFRFLYSLNPVTRLIESARGVFMTHQLPTLFDNAVIGAAMLLFLALGFGIFNLLQKRLSEEV